MLNKLKSKSKDIKDVFLKKIKIFSAALFVLGFTLDFITLPDAMNRSAYFIGACYAGTLLVFIFIREKLFTKLNSDKTLNDIIELDSSVNKNNETKSYIIIKTYTYISFAIAFILGSFSSFIFVYYFRSSDTLTSLPVLVFIFAIMIANELLGEKYRRFLDVFIYSLSMCLFFIFLVPTLVGRMGDSVFFISISISILFLYVFTKQLKVNLYRLVQLIPFVLLALYYASFIPAVPLSTRDNNFYESVSRTSSGGVVNYSKSSECQKSYLGFGTCYYDLGDGVSKRVYYYVEIRAPSELTATISHKWERYSEVTNSWEVISDVSYKVLGGRQEGYRGYTFLSITKKGDYKVSVIVDGKRHLGSKRLQIR